MSATGGAGADMDEGEISDGRDGDKVNGKGSNKIRKILERRCFLCLVLTELVPREWDRELVEVLASALPGQDPPTRVTGGMVIPAVPAGASPPGAEAGVALGAEAGVAPGAEAGVGSDRDMDTVRDGEVIIPAGNTGTDLVTALTHTGSRR